MISCAKAHDKRHTTMRNMSKGEKLNTKYATSEDRLRGKLPFKLVWWEELRELLPPYDHKGRGRVYDSDRDVYAFLAILRTIWDNKPMRNVRGGKYPTVGTLYRTLYRWASSNNLQRVWRAYLDMLKPDHLRAWDARFRRVEGAKSESRKNLYWVVDMRRILAIELAAKTLKPRLPCPYCELTGPK